jgi:LmbE family N-acetylglucosaminyl deacetylase
MMNMLFGNPGPEPFHVLCLGAHSDDIEIGCGATVLELAERCRVSVRWVVFSAEGPRRREAWRGSELFLENAAEREVVVKDYRDGFFPYQGSGIKDYFEELKAGQPPDLVFTHWRSDAHQDHAFIANLTWNTFRDHAILEYEVPKYDGDLGLPNLYSPVSAELLERKIENLFAAFPSQTGKRWFDRVTFRGLARIRGVECNSGAGYAEAFHCRKAIVKFGKSAEGSRGTQAVAVTQATG